MTHERDEIIRNRSRLKAEYGQLYTDIEQILFRHDPIGIAYEGHDSVEDNPDEYAPEVETILPRLRTANSADDVADIVYEEFTNWFGDQETVGPKESFIALSNEIWLAWTRFKTPTD